MLTPATLNTAGQSGRNRNDAADIRVVPTGRGTGAEIVGVDLAKPLDDAAFAVIEAAFDLHGVIYFRRQQIEPADQIRFSERFGPIEVNFNSDKHGLEEHPEIFAIGNVQDDPRAPGLRGVGQTWHSDMCYAAHPPRATMLYAIEVPELHGLATGDTSFANAALAYEALPEPMRARIDGRLATFDFTRRKRSRPVSAETVARYPPVQHPVVRTHPQTGRKSLYVMGDDCVAIEGVDEPEASQLIAALASHVLRPEFIYRHQWRAGDLLMWDNCTVQHKALGDYAAPQRRLLHRATIAGAPPA
ncbi:MAG: TauD/TfdA family dioxygenase [Pseudomonadota bacterium]